MSFQCPDSGPKNTVANPSSITCYNATQPAVPQSITNINIRHAIYRTDHPFPTPPAHLHKVLSDGTPVMLWGKAGHVEAAKVNIMQLHTDLKVHDITIYIRPTALITAAPGLFLLRAASILAPQDAFKSNTPRRRCSTRRRSGPGTTCRSPS